MHLNELFESKILKETAYIVWARENNRLVRKYRCNEGRRQGKIVENVVDCNKPLEVKPGLVLRRRSLGSKG